MAFFDGLSVSGLGLGGGGSGLARIDSLQDWFAALLRPAALIELATLALCFALAWALVFLLRRIVVREFDLPILFGRKVIDGVMFPMLLLSLAYLARALLAWQGWPAAVFKVALPVLVALAVIRLGVKVLQAAFRDAPLVRALERTVSWLVWLGMVLWVSGLLPLVLEELESISWRVGTSSLSARSLVEGSVTAGIVLILALWVSAAIESRLLRAATGSDLSLRKAVSNAVRALLVGVGLLVALSAVGIDLTALSVLGGALGVGVGFGLQKLAASYVSGFVMLAERSVRIGDQVRIDGFEGAITNINARYTVVRALSGRESVVPNEMFISNRIENLSLTDSRVLQTTVISVSYASDVELVMALMHEAAQGQARVLTDPAPAVHLTQFGADGLEFTLNYWIGDPENGQQNLRSAVNLAVLKSFQLHGIEIPYPQRVIHTQQAAASAPGAGANTKNP
jgi:small-conductance mechanosensitive channel